MQPKSQPNSSNPGAEDVQPVFQIPAALAAAGSVAPAAKAADGRWEEGIGPATNVRVASQRMPQQE